MLLTDIVKLIKNPKYSSKECEYFLLGVLKDNAVLYYNKGYETCRNDNKLLRLVCNKARNTVIENMAFEYHSIGIDSLVKLIKQYNANIDIKEDIDNYSNIYKFV
jgi:hypothetical protein